METEVETGSTASESGNWVYMGCRGIIANVMVLVS